MTALVITGPIVVIMADKVQSVANKYDPVKYDFTWNVYDSPSANNYGQKETRDGDNTVGSYHVLLPDGRTQKVSYTVDSYGGILNILLHSNNLDTRYLSYDLGPLKPK